ncbi:MAG: PspC domain-containing protein, partial [Aurantibacter sp.]
TQAPIWLLSVLLFFTIGIPFFFLLYLGLKILVNNLKSIGNIAKFSLLGLWLISIIVLIILGVREAASHAFEGGITTENELYMENASDTLNIQLVSSELWGNGANMRMNDMVMTYDDDGQPILLSDDVRFRLKKSKDSVIRIEVRKEANGPSVAEARTVAEKINYVYGLEGNTLNLDDYLTTTGKSKFRDQEVRVNLLLPAGTILTYSSESGRNWTMSADTDRAADGIEGYFWKMGSDGELKCQECPDEILDDDDDNRVRINEDGIDININDNGESFEMKMDEDGLKIKANDSRDSVNINIDGKGVKIDAKEN